MGGAYDTYGKEEKCLQVFWWGELKKENHSDEVDFIEMPY
jgi:hypothetical protein